VTVGEPQNEPVLKRFRAAMGEVYGDARNPGKAPNGPLPKPTLSPVPPVLSGPDQARFPPQLEEPWAGPDDSDNNASIISHAHGDNSRIIGNR
jgi:hypothetical protein